MDDPASIPVLVVTGPTATGKTALAVRLARRFGGEIVGADSRQVYRGLDLGTGKDLEEYGRGGERIACHLIDILDPMEDFDLFRFVRLARAAIADIHARGRLPVLCGGSPLYVHALLRGYELRGGRHDPELQRRLEALPLPELVERLRREAPPEFLRRVDLTQARRVIRALEILRSPGDGPRAGDGPLRETLVLAPRFPRAALHQRIEARLRERLARGMLREAADLHARGMTWERMEWLGLEYRYLARHLSGRLDYDAMFQQLLARIRQFGRRQEIWFRKMEREGVLIHWLPEGDPALAEQLAEEWIRRRAQPGSARPGPVQSGPPARTNPA